MLKYKFPKVGQNLNGPVWVVDGVMEKNAACGTLQSRYWNSRSAMF